MINDHQETSDSRLWIRAISGYLVSYMAQFVVESARISWGIAKSMIPELINVTA